MDKDKELGKIEENISDNQLNNKKTDDDLKQDKKNKHQKKKKEKPKTEIEILQEKIEELNQKLKEKDKQISEEKNRFAFLQAELENTRKHYIKQQEMTRKRTKINTITSFTPLIDSFEMALKSKENLTINNSENCQIDVFIEGFVKIYENLKTIFENFGVKPIEEINVPLDYKLHEVMMKIINDEVPEDTVLQIVHKGYKMNGEVIRPAKVVVSKKTPVVLPPEPVPEVDESERSSKDAEEEIGKKPEEKPEELSKEQQKIPFE